MKLARYIHNNSESYGVLDQKNLICLPKLAQKQNHFLPLTLQSFIAAGETAQKTAQHLLQNSNQTASVSVELSNVQLLAPIAAPPKIICLGWNYLDHTKETKTALPKEPLLFMKPPTAIIGPDQAIIKPSVVEELDYEGELAVIIGKTGKDLGVEEALGCVFGYTILNDISARDFQFKDKQWTRGKGFDTFAPTGPCITTKDQLPCTDNLQIKTWVNGELRQNGTTRDMIFKIPQIISHISQIMTLQPGDIIATGTPSGVGMAMNPQKWLQSGDVVRIEVEGIGVLENRVTCR